MTTGDIQAHLLEIYGTEISRETISKITDGIVEDMVVWQNRPLDRRRFLGVVANYGVRAVESKSARTSCGVRSLSTSRGRVLSSATT
jgi:hypothetical protein